MLVYNFHTKVFYVSSLYRRYVTLRYSSFCYVRSRYHPLGSYKTCHFVTFRYVSVSSYKVKKSSVRDQKLRVGLPIFKHNKQCRIRCVVTTGVIQHMGIGWIFRGRPCKRFVSSCKRTHQNLSQEHLLSTTSNTVIGITVRIISIRSKITSLAISCTIFPAHSPVESLLADCFDSVGVCSMEELAFFGFFAAFLSHADLLPTNYEGKKRM